MPTYRFACKDCGEEFEEWHSIHSDDLPKKHYCGGRLVKVITPPMLYGIGDKGEHTVRTDALERQWGKDMPAYKRLCEEGMQPKRIDGCDRLESTAVSRWHVNTGQPHPDHKVWEGMEMAKAIERGDT